MADEHNLRYLIEAGLLSRYNISNRQESFKMPSNSKKQWKDATLRPNLDRVPESREQFLTESGLVQDTVYTPEDLDETKFDYQDNLGYPGEYPYARGVQPNMYRGRIWTMRQYSGYATAQESNRRFRYLLDQGQTGLSVAFDLPTQIGYDSDHPLARGEVGKVGVPICHLADMDMLLKDIPLEKVSTSMTINATASILLCFYIAVAKSRGIKPSEISGTLQNDILKEYIARGTYAYPPRPSLRLVIDVLKYCSDNLPKWNSISISGYHMREAGATAVQELAFTLANGMQYVESAVEAGLNVDDFAGRLSFFFASHNNLFEEAAKFRAARRMWARIMKERFNAKNPRSMMLRMHAQTAGVTLTAQQPDNNVVRTTVQALAAILGGTQSLHVNSRDEALALPSEESAQLSLRTQQILAFESGIADVADPLGGSYFVENLTDRLESEALIHMKRIQDMGGAISALEEGYQMEEIHSSAYKHHRKVEDNELTIVGVNRYRADEPSINNLLKIDRLVEYEQIERLHSVRKKRNSNDVQSALQRLEEVARTDENTVPVILECVESYCTLGEICSVLGNVFGQHQEIIQ